MKTVALKRLGGFGNQLFRYAYACALCEQNGWELRTEPWVGEQIFTLDGHVAKRPDGTEDIAIDEYRQAQKDLIYSRADCRRWFAFRRDILDRLNSVQRYNRPYAHFRRGDYASAGYPLVSKVSVAKVMDRLGIPGLFIVVSDALPSNDPQYLGFGGELSFAPDFYRLMCAPILFRANSSFSWWAATLGHGKVFAPIITGFAGGVEHDNIPYVEGNWPRLASFEFTTDLHLPE